MTATAIEQEDLLTTGEIGRRYRVHRDTVWDWIRDGIKTVEGRKVRLQAQKIGGRWKSTIEWAEVFFAACKGSDSAPVTETPSQAEARAKAEQEVVRKKLGGRKRS